MDEHAGTEVPDDPPPAIEGEASAPPLLFLLLLWVPVFAVISWGMMLLFGRRPWEFSPDGIQLPEPPPGESEDLDEAG